MKIRIWLASVTVIILILLLALTVNHAREKDMVELFSRQQLSSAQNTAARMSDIFSQVEKNFSLFSRFDSQTKISSAEVDRDFKMLYSGWENFLSAIVLFDDQGQIMRILPKNTNPSLNFSWHFQALRKNKKQYIGLALVERSQISDNSQRADWYLIFGYPIWKNKNNFSGAWMISFSVAALVETYEKQIRENELGELWIIDENGKFIIHPDSAFIGENINNLVRNDNGTKIEVSSNNGNYIDSLVLQSDKKEQRSIIAYYPLRAGDKNGRCWLPRPIVVLYLLFVKPLFIRCLALSSLF